MAAQCSFLGSPADSSRLASSSRSFVPTDRLLLHRPQCPHRPRPQRRAAAPRALFGNKEGGGNPFGDMGKLMENIGKAQELVKTETQKLDYELKAAEFEGYNDDETVKVVVTGLQMAKAVDITDDALEKGSESVAAAVLSAMQEALVKSRENQEQRMRDLSKMFGLPQGQMGQPGL